MKYAGAVNNIKTQREAEEETNHIISKIELNQKVQSMKKNYRDGAI